MIHSLLDRSNLSIIIEYLNTLQEILKKLPKPQRIQKLARQKKVATKSKGYKSSYSPIFTRNLESKRFSWSDKKENHALEKQKHVAVKIGKKWKLVAPS